MLPCDPSEISENQNFSDVFRRKQRERWEEISEKGLPCKCFGSNSPYKQNSSSITFYIRLE